MPVANLLGVQSDMQLVLKISLSVAAVLLVSLAYRFYNSRSMEESPVQRSKKQQTCQRCKTSLSASDTGDNLLGPTLADAPSSDNAKGRPTEANPAQEASATCGPASTKGRRSPCFLKKLDGGLGVGRELRQDLERHGVYSSFLSKAEIKVDDAKLVLDSPRDQVVHGKIYEYYVETSSHCTTDPNINLGQNESKSELQRAEIGSDCITGTGSPLSVDPDVAEEPSLLGTSVLRPSVTSGPQRKPSYLAAAEQSGLPSPVPPSDSSTNAGPPLTSPSTNNEGHNVSRGSHQEAVAGSLLVHRSDLGSLENQLDLGNCLEALFLAKKHDRGSVVQAAIEVMSNNYLQVLRDADLYGRLTDAELQLIRRQRVRGRRFVMMADMDPQDCSRNSRALKRKLSALYYYDDCRDSWHKLCSIPQEVISKACAMCTMDNYLFVAVGCQGTEDELTPSKRVFCYNPLTAIWKEISPMNEARPRCKLAALDGYIYAVGGECLSSVERYDPRSDAWTFVASLPNDTFAVAHHVTVCNGELFVSGGSLRYMLLRYSPKSDTWRGSLMAGGKDRTADMVAVGPFLYRFEVNPLLGLSVYRYHTVARLWYECGAKRLPRCPAFQCVAMDDNIYCVGRHFTLRFEADEISPAFSDDNLSVASAAKGLLFPFVLSLPDKRPLQTSV
ncbi:kelch domain-containing protein 7A [Hippocampus comes]|uniref:kelch domain-containing protein 7A n=1 Tax=Hippocampus comes TaxID=109280 RepID=UPI00094E8047|nr:PREDICTED: kelch domain-containing protein 7A [Hippocampus comes]